MEGHIAAGIEPREMPGIRKKKSMGISFIVLIDFEITISGEDF